MKGEGKGGGGEAVLLDARSNWERIESNLEQRAPRVEQLLVREATGKELKAQASASCHLNDKCRSGSNWERIERVLRVDERLARRLRFLERYAELKQLGKN